MSKLLVPSALVSLVVACASPPPPKVAQQVNSFQEAPAAPPPKRAPAPVEPDGPGLEPTQISRVIGSRQGAVIGCYAITYGADEAPGVLTVGLQIGPDGSVRAAQVMNSSFADAAFHDCVIRVARDLRFPTAAGATEVAWRYRFGRSNADAVRAAY